MHVHAEPGLHGAPQPLLLQVHEPRVGHEAQRLAAHEIEARRRAVGVHRDRNIRAPTRVGSDQRPQVIPQRAGALRHEHMFVGLVVSAQIAHHARRPAQRARILLNGQVRAAARRPRSRQYCVVHDARGDDLLQLCGQIIEPFQPQVEHRAVRREP